LSRFNPEFFVVAKPAPQWPFWHPQNTPKRCIRAQIGFSQSEFSVLTCSRAGSIFLGSPALEQAQKLGDKGAYAENPYGIWLIVGGA